MGFGARLKQILRKKNMTLKELSEKTGISLNTLYSITKRDTLMPNPNIVSKIADVLQISEQELRTYDDILQARESALSTYEGFLQATNGAMAELKAHEDNIRKILYDMCSHLNIACLEELSTQALEMLKDENNYSFFDTKK